MKKLFLILNLICLQAAATDLVSFNEMAGNYVVESCLGRSSEQASLNYCRYSNLSILEVPGQPTQSQFIFDSEGAETLKFTIDTHSTGAWPAWKDLSLNEITLVSEMDQNRSKIVLQDLGTRKLLILQSESKDSSFKYTLILK